MTELERAKLDFCFLREQIRVQKKLVKYYSTRSTEDYTKETENLRNYQIAFENCAAFIRNMGDELYSEWLR